MPQNTFSKRREIVKYPIQVNDLNDRAKNRLRNFLISLPAMSSAIKGVDYASLAYYVWTDFHANDQTKFEEFEHFDYLEYREEPVLNYEKTYENTLRAVLENAAWYEYFDLLEYTFKWIAKINEPQDMIWVCEQINSELTKEDVGYRAVFVTQLKEVKFHPLSDENEQKSFEESVNSEVSGVREHFIKASNLFKNQDFYGSAREAVNALEAQLIHLGGNNNAGDALKNLKKQTFHPRLLDVAQKIYDYRNQELGHGKPQPPTISPNDAKFILVSSSAVVNFLESAQEDKFK